MQSLRLDAFEMLIGLRRPCAVSERSNPGGLAVFDETRTVQSWERVWDMGDNEPCCAGGTESRGHGDCVQLRAQVRVLECWTDQL